MPVSRAKWSRVILVRVLGVDRLTGVKRVDRSRRRDACVPQADERQLDPFLGRSNRPGGEMPSRSKSASSSRLIRASRLRLNAALTPRRSLYAGQTIDSSLSRSKPIRRPPPSPTSRAIVQSKLVAARGRKLPIVEPGK